MISESDIYNGYIWILGRPPERAEVSMFRDFYSATHADNAHDFRLQLISSEEFRARRIEIHSWTGSRTIQMRRERLAFMHIEKCGGTTLHAMLAVNFAEDRICPERFNNLGAWTLHELAEFDLYSGHFDFCYCSNLPRDTKTITMLRDPKARLLSLFYFWKAHLPHEGRDHRSLLRLARDLDAEEFFRHPAVLRHPNIQNAMVGQFIRSTRKGHVVNQVPYIEDDDPVMRSPELALEEAWANLGSMTTYGILERFDDSRMLLQRTLGLELPAREPLQVLDKIMVENSDLVPVEREAVTDHLDAALNDLTRIDQILYRRALDGFEQEIGRLEPQDARASACGRAGRTDGGDALPPRSPSAVPAEPERPPRENGKGGLPDRAGRSGGAS